MEKDIPTKAKGFLRKIYNNSKASLKTFRKFQDTLAKEFPGLVNKKVSKKEVIKDDMHETNKRNYLRRQHHE